MVIFPYRVARRWRLALGAALVLCLLPADGVSAAATEGPSPVLVELFTSEGCSSCPPADAILQQFDRTPPVSGVQLIVLSEHVDYWNHLGWKDPYSSAFFSDRQNSYARQFGLASAYTPEMVVDGATEFVGSNAAKADQAIEKYRNAPKIPVRISSASWDASGTVHAHLDAGPLPEESRGRKATLFLVAALDQAESQVAHGENQGRRLTHVAVVLSLMKIGSVSKGTGFSQDVSLQPAVPSGVSTLRLIAFVQETGPGRVLGAALQHVAK